MGIFYYLSRSWVLKFDGSSTESSAGPIVVIVSSFGIKTTMSFQLNFQCTNNQIECEAFIIGLNVTRNGNGECRGLRRFTTSHQIVNKRILMHELCIGSVLYGSQTVVGRF